MKGQPARARGGTSIAVAMGVMNVATYGYTIVAARLLGPRDYGAFAALMNVLLVVSVISLALQANAARRVSAEPGDAHTVEDAIRRVGLQAAAATAIIGIAAAPLLNWMLRLDSLATALLIAITAVPLTLMGYQAGVLQGARRWQSLGLMYVAMGVPRLVVGTIFLLWSPTTFWAMTGVMIASWAPVAVGAAALRGSRGVPGEHREPPSTRDLWRETLRNSHALLAFFALSNADVVIARSVMAPHEAGLYAAGLIMTKAVLFLPQFVVVLAFPSMGLAETRRRTLLWSLGAVGAIGLAVAGAATVLSGFAMVFVGGVEYAPIEDWLWGFALLGATLSMLQLLVYSVLARQARKSVYLVWLALGGVIGLGAVANTFEQLLGTVLSVDAGLLVVLCAISLWKTGAGSLGERPGSVGGLVPAVAGADRDVERNGQLGG